MRGDKSQNCSEQLRPQERALAAQPLTLPDVLVSSSDTVRDKTVVGRGHSGDVTPQGRSTAEFIFALGSLEML